MGGPFPCTPFLLFRDAQPENAVRRSPGPVRVREGRPVAELRDLLVSLRRRDDLLAKIAARMAVTAGIGAWEQARLPDNIFDCIGSRFAFT